jgi:hypothetical protein
MILPHIEENIRPWLEYKSPFNSPFLKGEGFFAKKNQ